MNKQNKKPRPYNRITPRTVADFNIKQLEYGNGSAAIRNMNPELQAPHMRAHAIVKKPKDVSTVQFIDDRLQQIGVDAIERVNDMVNSENESIATKNSHYVIDHIRGQATKRSITLSGKLNVQDILD